MSKREVVVISGARTAIGDYGGALKDFGPTKLGALLIDHAAALAARLGHPDAKRGAA